MNIFFKNWKTSTAFFIFIGCFVYSVFKQNVALSETTGFVALVSWVLLKASSDTFNDVVSGLTEAIKTKWSNK
ncbi:hypothetical protein ACN9J3_06105 [Aliarcobacter butzleri]|uniref:hypothetical protein n=1 Tax=Aliarcobacter butzleri TaxID=28197 RepID=UPI003B2232C4